MDVSNFHLVKAIDNVENDLTCMVQCSGDDQGIKINAWSTKQEEQLTCFCYSIDSDVCPTNSSGAMSSRPLYYKPDGLCLTSIKANGSFPEQTSNPSVNAGIL